MEVSTNSWLLKSPFYSECNTLGGGNLWHWHRMLRDCQATTAVPEIKLEISVLWGYPTSGVRCQSCVLGGLSLSVIKQQLCLVASFTWTDSKHVD